MIYNTICKLMLNVQKRPTSPQIFIWTGVMEYVITSYFMPLTHRSYSAVSRKSRGSNNGFNKQTSQIWSSGECKEGLSLLLEAVLSSLISADLPSSSELGLQFDFVTSLSSATVVVGQVFASNIGVEHLIFIFNWNNVFESQSAD